VGFGSFGLHSSFLSTYELYQRQTWACGVKRIRQIIEVLIVIFIN